MLGESALRKHYVPFVYDCLTKMAQRDLENSNFIYIETDGWKSHSHYKVISVVYSFLKDWELKIIPLDYIHAMGSQTADNIKHSIQHRIGEKAPASLWIGSTTDKGANCKRAMSTVTWKDFEPGKYRISNTLC